MPNESDDRLISMFAAQAELQQRLDPRLWSSETAIRIQALKDNVLACVAELYEALDETSWKWWSHSEPRFDDRRVFEELRDAQQFLMNAMLVATKGEATAHRLYVTHAQKLAVNHQREDDGYDGVTGKCPQCRRDLTEIEVKEIIVERLGTQWVEVRCVCGARLTERPA